MLVKDTLDEVRLYTLHYDKLHDIKKGIYRELDGNILFSFIFLKIIAIL